MYAPSLDLCAKVSVGGRVLRGKFLTGFLVEKSGQRRDEDHVLKTR